MSSLLVDLQQMRESGFDPSTIESSAKRNESVQLFLDSPIGDHLRSIENAESTSASDGNLMTADDVKLEIEELAPSQILFPLGFCPIWSSLGGNVIVYSLEHNAFYWADHTSFSPDEGTVMDPETYDELPFTPENVLAVMRKISDDPPEQFLLALKRGDYTEQLEGLD